MEHLAPFLGRAIPVPPRLGGQVKRSVIELASGGQPVVFNRMSGICEWQNAVMLFVNLPADSVTMARDGTQHTSHVFQPPSYAIENPPNGYTNVFYDEGRLMLWYAQNSHSIDHPLIQRLLSAKRNAHPQERILLFCRWPKPMDGAYVYFGRLEHDRHHSDTRPLQIVFRLLDYHHLLRHSGDERRSQLLPKTDTGARRS